MNEDKRNKVIAKGEDDQLNTFLDNRDEQSCEACLENTPYIMHDDMFVCQSCYEDACERAEYLADCKEDR